MIGFWLTIGAIALLAAGILTRGLIGRVNKVVLVSVLTLVPVVSLFGYAMLGASTKVAAADQERAKIAALKKRIGKLGSRSNVIHLMEQQLKDDPNNAKGLYLLGKLYLGGGEFDKALANLQRANQLEPDNIQISVTLVEVRFFKNNKRLGRKSKAILEAVLAQQPNQINALNLLALDAYNQHDDQLAVQYWERLLPLFPKNSPNAKAVLDMIAKAQKRLAHM